MSRRSIPLSLVISYGLLALGLLAASGAGAAMAAGPEYRVVAGDGTILHESTSLIRDLRTVVLPEASLELYLWSEESAGVTSSLWAVHRPGEGLLGRVRTADYRVELTDYSFDPLLEGTPSVPTSLTAGPSNRLHLVQLVVTPLPELQKAILDLGGTIHRYYTQYTLLVEMDAGTRAEVAALPFVRWVGPYHPAFRVEGYLRVALADADFPLGTERYSIMLNERGGLAQQDLSSSIRAMGGVIEVKTPQGFRMEATMSKELLARVANDDRAQFIDRWGGGAQTDMDIVRQVGGADYVEGLTGFSGEGVRGEIFDTELRTTHQEWLNAPIVHSSGTTGSLHGTSCYSNVFAQGVNAAARGMCPDGQGMFFRADEATQFGGTVTRYTIADELLDPAGPYRAVFQTSSVGNTRTFNYTTISAEMDDVLLLHQVTHTQSQSNACSQDSRPQAWAKNIVSVGGIRHLNTADRSDDFWCTSSGASIGPAQDGRIKPDLAFFYDSIFSASGSNDTSYTSFGGTSSATPQTAGHFGIFFQMWHEGVWAGHGGGASVFASRPNMATAKALLVNTAHRYDWNSGGANADIDRMKQGWGTADLRNLYDDAPDTTVIDESVVLVPLETFTMTVPVTADDPEFRATLVYLDPMGTPGAGAHRINDLSLKVTSPSATVYWGNNGLTLDNVSTSGGVSNTLDTVENVFLTDPEAGTWTVQVLADDVVEDSHLETPETDVDFALVVLPLGSTDEIFTDGFESGDTSGWSETVLP